MVRFLALAVAALLLVPPPLQAQGVFPDQNGAALAGLTSFNAELGIEIWMGMPGDPDRGSYQSRMNDAFESALMRDGVRVSEPMEEGDATLRCSVFLTDSNRGLVVYTYRAEVWERQPRGVHTLLWTSTGMTAVEPSDFDAERPAEDCANMFAYEWLRWNPGKAPGG